MRSSLGPLLLLLSLSIGCSSTNKSVEEPSASGTAVDVGRAYYTACQTYSAAEESDGFAQGKALDAQAQEDFGAQKWEPAARGFQAAGAAFASALRGDEEASSTVLKSVRVSYA